MKRSLISVKPYIAPPSGGPAPPAPPSGSITTLTNQPTLGLNVTSLQNLTDYVIDGTGDTAVLFQGGSGGAAGSSLKRARLLRVAEANAVTWGKHAVYGKARNLLLEDIEAQCSSHAASGFSMRYDGAIVRRFTCVGAGISISYYETSTIPGNVLFEDGDCTFTSDTGVWMDAETDYTTAIVQAFIFRRVNMTGPGAFMKVASGRFGGASVRFEQCKLNGSPLTSAGCPGVPNLTIVN